MAGVTLRSAIFGGPAILLVSGIKNRNDHQPFRMTALIFLSALGTLAVSFWL